MWEFAEIRKSASRHLSDIMDLVDKINVGIQYRVPDWLVAGYCGLASRQQVISTAEAERLGYRTAFRIGIIRESAANVQRYDRGGRIRQEFALELADAGMSKRDAAHIFSNHFK